MENMEKAKTLLKTSTKIVIIALIIVVLIFLSFFMVSFVPKILSSMANATVSITSAFFPADNKSNTTTATNNGTSSGVTLDAANGTSSSFLTNFFGPRKTDNNQPATFSIATSTKQQSSDNSPVNTGSNSNSSANNTNNNYQRASGIPDLAVQITSIGTAGTNGVFITTNNFTRADTIIVKFKIENQGSGPSGAWSMKVNMPSSNVNDQVKTISSRSIPAGLAVSGQAVFNTPAVGVNQKVTISIDPNGAILESNENNNQASVAINVTQINYNNNYNNGYNYNYNNNYNNNCPYGYYNGSYNYNCNNYNNLPNLTVRFVSLGKIDIYNQFTQTTYLRASDKLAVKFDVTNNGSVYTSSWSWKAILVGPTTYYNHNYNNNYYNGYTYNSDGSRTYITQSPDSGLAPGETRTLTVTFDSLTYGSNYVTITADSANSITESNEGDNTISQSFFVNY